MSTHNKEAPTTEQAPPLTKLIEREPTEEMLVAARKWIGQGWDWPAAIWRAMWDVARPEQAPAGEVPVDLRMLGYELEGVIIDVEQGHGLDDTCLGTIKRVRAALSTPPAVPPDVLHEGEPLNWQHVPTGHVIVPVEPTEEMHAAAVRTIIKCTGNDDFPPRVWKAMLSAAPAAPQPQKEQP